jgi:hypothetical protein
VVGNYIEIRSERHEHAILGGQRIGLHKWD